MDHLLHLRRVYFWTEKVFWDVGDTGQKVEPMHHVLSPVLKSWDRLFHTSYHGPCTPPDPAS